MPADVTRRDLDDTNRNLRAIDDYNEPTYLDPQNAAGFRSRGLSYFRRDRIDPAIEDFSEAIRLYPLYMYSYATGGIAYNQKGKHDRAIADFNEMIRLDPKEALAYNARGFVYAGKRDYVRAIADYDQALTLDPSLCVARQNRETLCGRATVAGVECQARLPGGVSAQAPAVGGSLVPLQCKATSSKLSRSFSRSALLTNALRPGPPTRAFITADEVDIGDPTVANYIMMGSDYRYNGQGAP